MNRQLFLSIGFGIWLGATILFLVVGDSLNPMYYDIVGVSAHHDVREDCIIINRPPLSFIETAEYLTDIFAIHADGFASLR